VTRSPDAVGTSFAERCGDDDAPVFAADRDTATAVSEHRDVFHKDVSDRLRAAEDREKLATQLGQVPSD
jgi:hypothetical protein